MTRILVSTSTFPVQPDDGIPRFILDLALALSCHAEVTVLAPDAPGAALRERLGDVEVHRFSYFWPRSWQRLAISNQQGMRENMRGSLLALIQMPLFLLLQAFRVRRLVRRRGIEVVNTHWLVPQGLTGACALRGMRDVKLVLHIHAGDVHFLRSLPIGRRIARFVVNRADIVFAAGSHARDSLNDLLGYDSKAILQSMGVDQARFSGNSENSEKAEPALDLPQFPDGFILFFGRLIEIKGTCYLLRALQILHQSKPGVGLIIAGYGPEEEALQADVDKLELHDRVQFVGRKSHDEIVTLLHACRLAAVPSIIDSRGATEGMPTVVVEALAAGVPVVGSNVDGIPDVIRHKENGWLCREKDPEDLCEKMILALDCDRNQIRKAATATAANYDWQQVAANYMAHINSQTVETGV